MNTTLPTVSSCPAMCAQTRSYFRPTWPLFCCSLAASLVRLCRCTVAIRAVGPEARHVAETTAAPRSIRGAESSKSKNLQQHVNREGSIAEAMVLAAAASTSAAASASPSPSRTAAADAVQLQPGVRDAPVARLRTRASATRRACGGACHCTSLPHHHRPPVLRTPSASLCDFIKSMPIVDTEIVNIA